MGPVRFRPDLNNLEVHILLGLFLQRGGGGGGLVLMGLIENKISTNSLCLMHIDFVVETIHLVVFFL